MAKVLAVEEGEIYGRRQEAGRGDALQGGAWGWTWQGKAGPWGRLGSQRPQRLLLEMGIAEVDGELLALEVDVVVSSWEDAAWEVKVAAILTSIEALLNSMR